MGKRGELRVDFLWFVQLTNLCLIDDQTRYSLKLINHHSQSQYQAKFHNDDDLYSFNIINNLQTTEST